ncbi:hypothetical protein [Paracoccus sp. ME4]|uniref:hypothetical protein n=1 Tax=Paracoccus sp. ME4 TaxID=3138066 RepID=UPI00398B39D6
MSERLEQFIRATGYEGIVRPEWVRILPGDRYVMAKPLMFHWSIITGSLLDETNYDDRWCYASGERALEALASWPQDPPGDYEPEGWHRHPATGRRREDADPEREHFAP